MSRTRWQYLGLIVLPLLMNVACSSPDVSGPTSPDPSQLPWSMSLSAHAITMDTTAPYNQLQLTAVPTTETGQSLPDTTTVTFTSSDSSVNVSANGLLTARKATSGVRIVASTVYQGIRLSDTAFVNVTASAQHPVVNALQFQLPAGDTSFNVPAPNYEPVYYDASKTLQIGALDSTGTRISNVLIEVRSSDPLQAAFGSGVQSTQYVTTTNRQVTFQLPQSSQVGQPFTMYATATVYGVTFRDSLQFTVAPPLMIFYSLNQVVPVGETVPVLSLSPRPSVTISVGGWVYWINNTGTASDSLDVVFDDSTAASPDPYFDTGGGNMSPFPGGDFLHDPDFTVFSRSRQFLRPGTFPWHSVLTGVSGTVIVQ